MVVDIEKNPELCGKYICYFNGTNVTDLIYLASEEFGYIRGYIRDRDGKILLNASKTAPLTFITAGIVELIEVTTI